MDICQQEKEKTVMERPASVATGVPQLDLILGGGVVQNSLILIGGVAGSGKTVLAAQIACAAADRDERVLFVTAFSEPHNKLIANLQGFRFFNQNHIGGRIKLLNLQHQLSTSLEEAADTIVREAREHKARLVVLDGIQGILVTSNRPAAPHQFLYDLSAKLNLLNVTTVVTYDLSAVADATRPELTAVDGVIALNQELIGDRAIRTIQVVKQRGANPLLGRHTFTLTDEGVICYPRQETMTQVKDVAPGAERMPFGISALDTMLEGGPQQGTSTIVAGAEGTGKTVLGLQYAMHGVARNERALLISFNETAQQLVAKGRLFGLGIQAALDSENLLIRSYPLVELNPDAVAQEIRLLVESASIQRLIIDSIGDLERQLVERQRAGDFFASLVTFLRNHQLTTCITVEIDPIIGRDLSFAGKSLAALSDNVIFLEHVEVNDQQLFALTVLKMRYSGHDRLPHSYNIDSTGINLAPTPLVGAYSFTRRKS
ncbi:MAG TPA: ATPase domain-containing protein [Herpetosiphonaceae bacterium]